MRLLQDKQARLSEITEIISQKIPRLMQIIRQQKIDGSILKIDFINFFKSGLFP
jgi:hypothetical protein